MQRNISFKVEKRRVLVPVGIPCPFGCKYCYTRGGEVGLARKSAIEILSCFQTFAAMNSSLFDTIQFGYDGDPFAFPEHGISMLNSLATMDKHVNFSTKASLTPTTLAALGKLNVYMGVQGITLSGLVSLSCWDSASFVEPHTPSPQERIETIVHLKKLSIPVFVALRPILPHIADVEYERIIVAGCQAGCDGFILGPLYADDREQFVRFIPPEILREVPYKRNAVSWSPHAPVWTRYEQKTRTQQLFWMIKKHGGRTFHSSADAMGLFHREKVAV